MAKIIHLPPGTPPPRPPNSTEPPPAPVPGKKALWRRVLSVLYTAVFAVVMLTWPLVSKVWSLYCVFLLLRWFWYWDNPEVNAGWTAFFHIAGMAVVMFILATFPPKAITEDKNPRR